MCIDLRDTNSNSNKHLIAQDTIFAIELIDFLVQIN
jgi:hypothetical protein